jgi:hypothetical protein
VNIWQQKRKQQRKSQLRRKKRDSFLSKFYFLFLFKL